MLHIRWRILLTDIFHYLVLFIAIMIFIWAIFLSAVRLALPLVSRYQTQIANGVSEFAQAPVTFGSLTASWHKLQPQIDLKDVNVWSEDQHVVMRIPEVSVRVSLFNSLLHRKLEFGLLQVKNWQMKLYQNENGEWQIAGMEHLSNNNDTSNESKIGLKKLLAGLNEIKHLQLQEAQIQFQSQNFPAITLARLNVDWYSHSKGPAYIYGNTYIEGKGSSPVQFAVTLDKNLDGRAYLKLEDFNLTPWVIDKNWKNIFWQQGTITGEVWTKWQQEKLQEVATDINLQNLNIVEKKPDSSVVSLAAENLKAKMNWQVVNNDLHFLIQTENGKLQLGKIFRELMSFDNLELQGHWQKTADQNKLHIGSINIKTNDMTMHAEMKLNWNNIDSPMMYLSSKANFQTLKNASHYLPAGIMPPGVVTWLDEGILNSGPAVTEMLWHGPVGTFPFHDQSGTMQITAKVQDMTLNYLKDWPLITHMNADLFFTSHGMHILAEEGDIGEMSFKNISADILEFKKGDELNVAGNINGDMNQAWNYLTNSGLRHALGPVIEHMQAAGPFGLKLNLNIPLGANAGEPQYQGNLILQNDNLQLKDVPILLEKVSGPLSFSNQTFQANLTTLWNQEPWTLKANKTPQDKLISMDVAGKAPLGAWIAKEYSEQADWVKGSAVVNGKLSFATDANKNFNLNMNSNLVGIAINTPIGIKKTTNQVTPFNFGLSVSDNKSPVINGAIVLPEGKISLSRQNSIWSLNAPFVAGSVNTSKEILQVNIGFLNLQNLDDFAKNNATMSSKIPPMDIQANKIVLSKLTLNSASGSIRPLADGTILINNLAISQNQFNIKAGGSSVKTPTGEYITTLKGNLTSADLGTALKALDLPNLASTDKANMNFDLNWPGKIWQFDKNKLTGTLQLKTGQGVFTDVSGSTSTKISFGKMLSLLSLSALPQHLTSKFDDLTQKGFPFDKIDGQMNLMPGKMNRVDMQIQGPVADVAINGCMNFDIARLNLVAEIKPKLTGSLPVIATLAGGPVIGAIGFLADKILSPAVGQLSASYYAIQGDQKNPQTNKISGSQSQQILRSCPI